jgi:L-iditol 2-dehydrogenase
MINPSIQNTVVACQGGEETALENRPTPEPGPGEILLGLRVVGFCGTDLFKLTTGSAQAGTVLGHEVVGEGTVSSCPTTCPAANAFCAGAATRPCATCSGRT